MHVVQLRLSRSAWKESSSFPSFDQRATLSCRHSMAFVLGAVEYSTSRIIDFYRPVRHYIAQNPFTVTLE